MRPDSFNHMYPEVPINHERSCLILYHIAPLSSKWNRLYKQTFQRVFVLFYYNTNHSMASKVIFHKVCIVQYAQNDPQISCAKVPLQIGQRIGIMISYNEWHSCVRPVA